MDARAVLLANHDDQEASAAAVRVLNGALRRARVSIAFSVTGPAQWTVEPASDEVDGAIGRLSVVIEAMAGGTGRRLEVCASDDCRWAFYDRGRARSGSWCSMALAAIARSSAPGASGRRSWRPHDPHNAGWYGTLRPVWP